MAVGLPSSCSVNRMPSKLPSPVEDDFSSKVSEQVSTPTKSAQQQLSDLLHRDDASTVSLDSLERFLRDASSDSSPVSPRPEEVCSNHPDRSSSKEFNEEDEALMNTILQEVEGMVKGSTDLIELAEAELEGL
eukprot:gnl/MRDRNA2_/MRDRNA2_24783_c0_seq1.p2 gnl/MRDRNA2_/MRDRNA2_24783_c0~~gnl/MRDRNA2_/MRDRNA2_24783_c0_seq1.p2  ORF type:complete len:133 (+),score=27.66 gnl/MRDRNA2_/MRDRNA2_24783_c0_seq1:124-522(+)